VRPMPGMSRNGRLRSPQTLRLQIQRELRKSTALAPREAGVVRTHPSVRGGGSSENWSSFLEGSGAGAGTRVRVEAIPALRVEEFEIGTS
jgi:hypothetical protein